MQLPPWMQWRCRSSFRGGIVAFASVIAALSLSHFPQNRANFLIVFPVFAILAALVDTSRCMTGRWSWYHGGILLLIYMELMALTLVVFLLLYPLWL